MGLVRPREGAAIPASPPRPATGGAAPTVTHASDPRYDAIMTDPARRALIAKTYGQLNHELPIMFYAPMDARKDDLWRGWLNDPAIRPAMRRDLGLYVHIPYCTQVCSFCYLEKRLIDDTVPDFMDTLLAEIDDLGPLFAGHDFRTVYLGGGTPGSLSVARLTRLFSGLRGAFQLDGVQEFGLETDLPSLTEDKLHCYRDHGLTRLSVGLQNLDPSVLAQNKRLHAYDIDAKLALLDAVRFRDLNLDIIVGIPGSALENVEQTVNRALQLRPTRISLYTFNPFTGYDFDFSDAGAVASLIADRRAQQQLAKGLIDAAQDRGDLPNHDNLQLDLTMRNHCPLLGLGPSANNRLPLHAYYANPKSQQYLSEPEAIRGWGSGGLDEELEFHMYNRLIRDLPIDLRLVRTLFGVLPSQAHEFAVSRLGDRLRFSDGVLEWTGDGGVARHLKLLQGLDVTRNNLDRIAFPKGLEGLDEEWLLDVLIGY